MRRAAIETIGRWRAMQLATAARATYWSLIITGVLAPALIGAVAKFSYTKAQPDSPYFSSVISWSRSTVFPFPLSFAPTS